PLDVPIGKVYELNEVENDPHVLAREMVMELDHPTQGKIKHVGYAFKMSDTPGSVRNFAPLDGENTNDILKDLGYDQEAIETLRQKGAIS
ncbi:CoA transferase, partial [Thermodesulfobacteriota bacterium]